MARHSYTAAQLANAHSKTGDQIMRNGKPVYTLTASDLNVVARYNARTPKRIARNAALKAQKLAAEARTNEVRVMVNQRESRIAAMARMVNR